MAFDLLKIKYTGYVFWRLYLIKYSDHECPVECPRYDIKYSDGDAST